MVCCKHGKLEGSIVVDYGFIFHMFSGMFV